MSLEETHAAVLNAMARTAAEIAPFRTRSDVIAQAHASGVLHVHDSAAARGLALTEEVTLIGQRNRDFERPKKEAIDLLLSAFASGSEETDFVERVGEAARASLGSAMEEFSEIEVGEPLAPPRAQRVLELIWQAEKQVEVLEEFAASFFAVARVALAAADAGLIVIEDRGTWVEPLVPCRRRGLPLSAEGPAWLRDVSEGCQANS